VAEHLSTLGTALEAPISRLIETASEAPKAAADVIAQLRQEISVSVARDNALLEERTRILETLSTLLDAINHASSEQRGVIDAMVNSSQAVLAQASDAFTERVNGETDKLGSISAQVTASAIDVASLGESFGVAVRAFTDNSEKLSANLERIEAAMAQSMQRSDEQLAYYVAQARELIDLSISSQKDVLDALAQRPGTGAA
jgi:ABC-type transporter Mla subunit MlaD